MIAFAPGFAGSADGGEARGAALWGHDVLAAAVGSVAGHVACHVELQVARQTTHGDGAASSSSGPEACFANVMRPPSCAEMTVT